MAADALKNLLYAGIGLASEATQRVQKELDNLVEKGKLSNSEAKKVINEFISKTEEKKGEFEKHFKETIGKLGYTKSSEIAELRKRIDELESKLGVRGKAKAQ